MTTTTRRPPRESVRLRRARRLLAAVDRARDRGAIDVLTEFGRALHDQSNTPWRVPKRTRRALAKLYLELLDLDAAAREAEART